MGLILPLAASILQAASFSLDKLILSVKKATHKQYLLISFPLITIFTFLIFLIVKPSFNLESILGNNFFMIILAVCITLASNLIFYSALRKDYLSEIQTIELLKNFPLIIFSALIFQDERNYLIIILSLISAASVAWSHYKNKRFRINNSTMILLAWNLIASPFRGIISKKLLETLNPIVMQLIIDLIVSIVLIAFLYKEFNKTPKKALPYFLLTNLLTSVAWILYFYSYQLSGIIYTVLVFSLQPILVYLSSMIFFKEKFQIKKFVSFAIILISIIIAQF